MSISAQLGTPTSSLPLLLGYTYSGGGAGMATPLATMVLAETGLAHFYELAETTGTTAVDSKGAINGGYTNGPTLNQISIITSESSPCPSFANASAQFVDLHATTPVPRGTNAFTWEAWVVPTSASVSYMRIMGADDASGNGPSLMYDGANNQWHGWRTTSANQITARAGPINHTYHVVMTYDGKVLSLYIDGQSRGGIIDTTSISTIGGTFNIGATGNYGSFWQGELQYVAMYTVCLTGSQIKKHYRQGFNSPITANNAHFYGAYLNDGQSWDASPPAHYGELDTWSNWATNNGATTHRPGLFHCFANWANNAHFPIALAQQANQRGKDLFVTWEAWDPSAAGTGGHKADQPTYALQNIVNYNFDAYINTWAADIKSYRLPVFIRLFHEFNGDYYPWSIVLDANNNSQSDYVTPNTEALIASAWIHVWSLFNAAGVTNVKWVWCPNIFTDNYSYHPFTATSYPGDTHVDYVGLDGYCDTTNSSTNLWLPFFDLYSQAYDTLTSITSKLMMIPEMGCAEDSTAFYSKATWITQALGTDLPQSFPSMAGFVWEDDQASGHNNWSINTSTASLAAFQAQIASSQYAGLTPLAINTPVLSAISPNTDPAGTGTITLTVTGNYFELGSVVNWAGTARTTTYVSATQITAVINASDLATAGTYAVNVITPSQPSSMTTSSLNFTVTTSASPPTLTSLTPSSVTAGAGATTLTVNGSNFVSGCTGQFNGSNRTTTFISSTQVQLALLSADTATTGSYSVTVTNVGAAVSNTLTFSVANTIPSLLSLSPNSFLVGASGQTIVANGGGFVNGCVATTTSGSPGTRATTFVSASQIQVALTSVDFNTIGTFYISVANPGTGSSNTVSFAVSNLPPATLNSLSPNSTLIGSSSFTLTLNGSSFYAGAVVNWNGSPRTPSSITSTQITVTINAADVSTAGSFPVSVTNPSTAASNTLNFNVTSPNPSITNINPTSAIVNTGPISLSVTGSGFTSSSKVLWNGTALATTYVSPTQLTAIIPATDLTTAGNDTITVQQ